MEIKYYDQQGIVAWSNSKAHSELLTCATLEPDQNQLYHLDILSLDMQERSKKLNRVGNGYTDIPFRCIAWDNFGQKQGTLSHGILFGGMQNGSFSLWDPSEMIATYETREAPSLSSIQSQSSIIYAEDIEEGSFPLMCAQWNSLKNNFLAFGSTDVLLLDVGKDCYNPEIVKPGKKNPHEGSYVTSVSWNKQVAHILASASENGLIALWDIKTDSSIFQFKDSPASSSGNRNVVICWSKNISTQIAVTLDDEKRNQLQIWDLRNQKGPIVVIDKPHSKGINAMDWCETDPELILTAGRDRKVVCWNYTQDEEPLNETNINSDIYDVKWSKKLPSIFSVCTNKTTSICTLNDTNLFSYVPKWYKVPVGSTFLGNEAVLTFSQNRGKVLHENKIIESAKKSVLKQKLKELLSIIEGDINQKDMSSEFNELMKAKGSSDDSQIYNYLGFNKGKIVKQVEKYTGKKRQFAIGNSHQQKAHVKARPKAYTPVIGQEAASFFAEIGAKTIQSQSRNQQEEDNQNIKYDMVPRNFNWDCGKERLIKQNILIGNYEGAIDAALKCGRTAEALIIAYSVNQNTFNEALKTFFTETTDNFITDILKHIAHRDTEELVKKYDLRKWKQCIALIYSISSSERRAHLLKVLANRLQVEIENAEKHSNQLYAIEESTPSIICFILAEQFQGIAALYFQNLSLFKPGSQQRKSLAIEYARRLILIERNLAVDTPKCKQYEMLLRQVAFICIEQNEKILAHTIFTTFIPQNSMKYIDYLVHSSKDLEKYKSSITYKSVIIPAMQPRKVEKKINSKDAYSPPTNMQNQGKNKNKIFANKDVEVVKPPPSHVSNVRQRQEVSNDGFSPYENHQKQQSARANNNDKSRNVPPPPPQLASHKKIISPPPIQYQKEPEKDQSFTKLPPQKRGPPPPPPSAYQAEQKYEQEEEKPVQSFQKLPPQKSNTAEKKSPPPPPISKVLKRQSEESFTQESKQEYQPNTPTNVPKFKGMPPPPPPPVSQKHEEYSQIANQPQRVGEQINKKLQPPPFNPPRQRKQVEEVKQSRVPPQNKKVQEKKDIEYERERETDNRQEPVAKKTLPPPPGIRKPPPPPPARR